MTMTQEQFVAQYAPNAYKVQTVKPLCSPYAQTSYSKRGGALIAVWHHAPGQGIGIVYAGRKPGENLLQVCGTPSPLCDQLPR